MDLKKKLAEQEFYKFTFQELVEAIGEEEATKKAQFYKKDFLSKYPADCVIHSPLLKTYQESE